ncbi:MAG: transcription antitermination factor NusB [Emergencia sp.]
MDKNRKTAYSTLLEIERNQAFSNIELNRQIKEQEPDSPAFVRELVYGVLETKRYLDYVLSQLIPKGLKGVKKQTLTLLRMGLYQILYMDSVPDYAAVSDTVKLAPY